MKKLFVLGIVTALFLTGCSVNFSGLSGFSIDEKYRVKTYEEFKDVENDLDKDYIAIERIEKMDLKDTDSIKVLTIFEDIEIVYEDRNDVEIQYFAFVSSKAINKEPVYNISTKNDFIFEVEWKKLTGNNYGMMRIFVPEKFEEDVSLKSISGDISGDKIVSKDLNVETVSGDVYLDIIEAKNIAIESISGDVRTNDMTGKDLDISSTSGDVKLSNMTIEGINIESISGDVVLNIKSLEDNISIDLVSGDLTLSFDEEPSAVLDLASISGDVDCDYSLNDVDLKKESSLKATIDGGKHRIDVETISGDITIK